jgi:transposase
LSTKIHALVDALGNPLGFHLTPGQACDLDGADVLLNQLAADTLLADKGYDADERVIERLKQQGKTPVIPPKCNRTVKREYDRDLYKARHLIENFFAQLKQYRAIATRYDKRATNFLGAIYLAAIVIWLNLMTRPSLSVTVLSKINRFFDDTYTSFRILPLDFLAVSKLPT